MTVISGMKFNANEGAVISDEQSSSDFRKENIATKIHEFSFGEGLIALVGGSGVADILFDSIRQARELFAANGGRIKKGSDIANGFAHIFMNVGRQYSDGSTMGELGIKQSDFIRGYTTGPNGEQIPLSPEIKTAYQELRNRMFSQNGLLRNGLLLLTYDNQEVELYNILMNRDNPVPIARPSDAIGSGSEQVEDEIAYFLDTIPRSERGNIDPITGITELLYGTERASIRNPGVGGTPLIKILRNGKIISPGERETRLAVEIVKGNKKRYLEIDFARNAIDSLMYQNARFENIEKRMWEKATDQNGLSLMLRGYKV